MHGLLPELGGDSASSVGRSAAPPPFGADQGPCSNERSSRPGLVADVGPVLLLAEL